MTVDRPIGITRLRGGHQMTLVVQVAKYLGVEDGDYIGFYEHPDGLLIAKVDASRVKPKG
jgi:hypothetical protein